MNKRLKNSQIPILLIPRICTYCSGTKLNTLIFMITSIDISKHTENNIAAFLIAPSIPTHELNLCSLIARSAPSIESNDTQISNALKSILLLNRIIISFIILIVLSYLVFCIKIRPISVLL